MQDFVDTLVSAPGWAQAAMAAIAAVVAWIAYQTFVTPRRYKARFHALAAARGTTAARFLHDPEAERFTTAVGGRDFEVQHRIIGSGGGSGGHGRVGRVLFTVTPLAGQGWDVHPIAIRARSGPLKAVGDDGRTLSGDAAFDERFRVQEQGVRLPEGWLTPPRRAAIAAFFDASPRADLLEVDGGALRHQLFAPFLDLTPGELDTLLRRQADVAAALDPMFRRFP